MENKDLYKVGLTMVNGVGDAIARNLLTFFHGDAELIFQESQRHLEKVSGVGPSVAAAIRDPEVLRMAEKELEFVAKNKIRIYFLTDDDYPQRLRECADHPILFYYKGIADLNAKHVISVVGTRSFTSYGRELTDRLVEDLAVRYPDLIIVSGLAYGIDIQAHRAALKHDLPTVAVLAHGLDRIYPSAHRDTAVEMLKQGGLLTEFPHDTTPEKSNFVKRNRIVAGLTEALIVVEAPQRSGSLITANLASSYGREVFSFPGRTTDSKSLGCNTLIRTNKAGMILSAEDLVSALSWDTSFVVIPPSEAPTLPFSDDDAGHLLALIHQHGEVYINELAHLASMPIYQLSSLLCDLETKNFIVGLPGGKYRIAKT
ncbi:MAG: DNA-processing protein DprA [Tannerellaceae bacterium]|jgi:DNA processing protein|nr:DNA-processing protein DprA [Tannerellaceae bacterium]